MLTGVSVTKSSSLSCDLCSKVSHRVSFAYSRHLLSLHAEAASNCLPIFADRSHLFVLNTQVLPKPVPIAAKPEDKDNKDSKENKATGPSQTDLAFDEFLTTTHPHPVKY